MISLIVVNNSNIQALYVTVTGVAMVLVLHQHNIIGHVATKRMDTRVAWILSNNAGGSEVNYSNLGINTPKIGPYNKQNESIDVADWVKISSLKL